MRNSILLVLLLCGAAAIHGARAEPYAYLADPASGNVVVTDVPTGGIALTIPVGGTPRTIEISPSGSFVHVGNQGVPGVCVAPAPGGGGGGMIPPKKAPYVTMLQRANGAVVGEVALPVFPDAIAASSDDRRLYIAGRDYTEPCLWMPRLAVVDIATKTVVSVLAPPTSPIELWLDERHGALYLIDAVNEVHVLDVATASISRSIRLEPALPSNVVFFVSGAALDAANGKLYVGALRKVYVIDTSTNAVVTSYETSSFPVSLAIHPSGSPLLVSEMQPDVVRAIDTHTGASRSTAVTPAISMEGSPDGQWAYALTINGVSTIATSIRLADMSVAARRDLGSAYAKGRFIAPAGTASAPPGVLTGLWWNPAQSGWGIHLTQRRDTVFAAWFTYDVAGNAKWYTSSDCGMSPPPPCAACLAEALCSGYLYESSGPAFFTGPFVSAGVTTEKVGVMQIRFHDADHASMTWVLASGGVHGVDIQRQLFGGSAVSGATDYTDLWFNPLEAGWGLGVTHRAGGMFLTWFVYDDAGAPTWLFASDCEVKSAGNGCTGSLYRAAGPVAADGGAAFDVSSVKVQAQGSVDLTFSDANTGILNYTVNGRSGTKTIVRQVF